MPSLGSILEKLNSTRADLLRIADGVGSEQWQKKPEQNAWSAAEVIAHLTMVERGVTNRAHRIVQHPPKRVPFFKRVHVPVSIVSGRILRRKTPIPLEPALLGPKEEMLATLRTARESTLAFLHETQERDLAAYRWPHPFLGSLGFYQWFLFIAAHERRHTKQILEIVEKLRK